MDKNKAKKFIENNKAKTVVSQVHFTTHQLNALRVWAETLDVDEKDVPMLFVHHALMDVQNEFLAQQMKSKTRQN